MLQRARRNWFWLVWGALIVCLLLNYFGAFSPLLSPTVYPQLAPAGWRNITPHGRIVLDDFDASTTAAGLMIACGTSYSLDVTDPSTWKFSALRFWLSHDGGATWQALHPPLPDDKQCAVAFRVDGGIYVSQGDFPQLLDTGLVSYDDGKTWQREPPLPTAVANGKVVAITPLMLRGDTAYGSYDSDDSYGDSGLAVSADNGQTWEPLAVTPSMLVEQGWKVDNHFTPDYRNDHWWYRTIQADGTAPTLEHSVDDGQHWMAVGQVASGLIGGAVLAVNPQQPGHICAAYYTGETNHVDLFASADGGTTWRAGVMPLGYENTSGERSYNPQMDAQGTCYQGYHFKREGSPDNGLADSRYIFFRLTPQSDTLQSLPVTGDDVTGEIYNFSVRYVPAVNGMSGRLVAQSLLSYRSWAAVFSDPAGEASDLQILWTPVP